VSASEALTTRPADDGPVIRPTRTRSRLLAWFAMPAVLALVCLGLWLYVGSQELDSIESRSLNAPSITAAVIRHVELAAVSTVLVIALAVPLGVFLTRPFTRRIRGTLLTLANIGQAVPTIGLLALLAVGFFFLGFWAGIVGLVAYAVLPVLRNTMVGLEQVDASVLEAGRGMGLSRGQVLRELELPLAVPVILAGVRTALVINVGTATLVAYINGGGLGTLIVAGFSTNRILVSLTGAVLAAVLALFIDHLAGVAEDLLRPKGL
jgi:osmoprotectant transport system permease protein